MLKLKVVVAFEKSYWEGEKMKCGKDEKVDENKVG